MDRTRQVWPPRLGRDMSCEDSRQIAENLTGFFSVLAEWSQAEKPSPPNDRSKSTAFDDEAGVAVLRVTAQPSGSIASQRATKS